MYNNCCITFWLKWGSFGPIINLFFIFLHHRNKAIADYFQQCGYTQTLEKFKEETNMQDDIEKRFANLLEKKWTSVIRLQRKVFYSASLTTLPLVVTTDFLYLKHP